MENPLFSSGQQIRLSKLNLVFGPNDTGKTAMTEWLAGCFDASLLDRWRRQGSATIEVRLSFLNPELHTIEVRTESDTKLEYRINGRAVPFNPIGIRTIRATMEE